MIRTSETVAEFSAAWVAAQAEMPNVPRETKGQVGSAVRYYADLATVVETVRPVLAKHGLSYLQGCSDGDKTVTITTRLLHRSGEWIEDSLSMPTGQNTAQAVGSALSYGRRYSLMAILGLAPEDDDGAAASAAPRRAAPRPPREPDDVGGDPSAITGKQLQMISIGMKELGLIERGARLAYVAAVVNRDVESSKDLTKHEASKLIDQIELDKRSNPENP